MNLFDGRDYAMTEDEIAKRLGVNRGTVNVHLKNAHRKLRRELGSEWRDMLALMTVARRSEVKER